MKIWTSSSEQDRNQASLAEIGSTRQTATSTSRQISDSPQRDFTAHEEVLGRAPKGQRQNEVRSSVDGHPCVWSFFARRTTGRPVGHRRNTLREFLSRSFGPSDIGRTASKILPLKMSLKNVTHGRFRLGSFSNVCV